MSNGLTEGRSPVNVTHCFSPDGAPEVDDAPPEWGGLVLVGGFLVGCQSDLFVFGFGVYFPSSLGPFDCGLAVADFSRLLSFGRVVSPDVHCSHHPFLLAPTSTRGQI